MRIVGLVDECEAGPGVPLHVEHKCLDFDAGGFRRDARAPGTTQIGLHLLKIDHGRPQAVYLMSASKICTDEMARHWK